MVGSGPNGLAAAVELALAGLDVTVVEGRDEIGGGCRSAELTVPGVVHDVCAAVHPLGAASPVFARHDLDRHGLRWLRPPVGLAHPLDGGRAVVEHADLHATATALGVDADRWRAVFGPIVARVEEVLDEVLQPLLHVPAHPVDLARFGLRAALPARVLAGVWRTEEARALFAGIAAHAVQPLGRPLTSAVGLMLGAVGQAVGWPVAAGGSASIASALAARLDELDGRIETGRWVRRLADVADADVVLFDTTPTALARIAGDALDARERRAFERWRYGPAAFKVDLAVEGGVPWVAEPVRQAGTVHVGGTLEEIAVAERMVARGRMPRRPFVLVAQQHVADHGRSVGDVHPVWAYAHVPNGWDGDATAVVLDQVERFAPGLRERIVGSAVRGPAELAAGNPNYVGGDIAAGAADPVQLLARPRLTGTPYRTTASGVYLCSSATPPAPGVHGMCGANAAAAVLADLRA